MNNPLIRHGFSSRVVAPQGLGSLNVLVCGEAPGESEDANGVPFWPGAPAGSVLERAFTRQGMRREQFTLTNVVPCRPPNNFLDGAPWEAEAVAWGMTHLDAAIADTRPRAILALGNVATRATTGLAGDKLGVSLLTGYVLPSRWPSLPVIPCFHPSYLRRGAMSHFKVLMDAIRKAVAVAREQRQPVVPDPDNPPREYHMYPSESEAWDYAAHAQLIGGYLAYDIETPYSTNEDAAEEADGIQTIKSIQFSHSCESGIFLPWRPPFIEIAKHLLASRLPKLGWNTWRFDDPVLRSAGVHIQGPSHDLMWAHHHLQPDLPRGLQFVAGQNGWPFPWKHLDKASPSFYGIVDVDVLQFLVA